MMRVVFVAELNPPIVELGLNCTIVLFASYDHHVSLMRAVHPFLYDETSDDVGP